jgi:hypothetical protein
MAKRKSTKGQEELEDTKGVIRIHVSKSKSRPLVIHDLTRVIRRAPLVEKELIILPKFTQVFV